MPWNKNVDISSVMQYVNSERMILLSLYSYKIQAHLIVMIMKMHDENQSSK